MLRIIVDSGSSIKQWEKEQYGVDIIPLKILFDEEEFLDGVNMDNSLFYHKLVEEKKFPKTSLPSIEPVENMVDSYLKNGDQVLIITISSEISGTYNMMRMLFEDKKEVLVIDSELAVGGIRFLVEEAIKYKEETLQVIEEKLKNLIPRIHIMAIPETLDYLLRGGRLSKSEWMLGSLLSIKPVIGFEDGKVTVITKKRGIKAGMTYICQMLEELSCDKEYGIIASYTKEKINVDKLIKMAGESYENCVKCYDDLDHAIACHWGPNAFGFIFVEGNK